MILRKIDYHEFKGEPNYWALKDLTLEKINLLVGKNATGKTNAITKITRLGNMLAGLRPQLLHSGDYYAEFADAEDVYKYYLSISRQNVILEKLEINGDEKLTRSDDGTGEIYAEELGCKMKFQLSTNHLVIVLRRDAIQHPYLKKLLDWANGMRMYAFGSSLGKDIGFSTTNINQLVVDPRDPNQVAGLYAKGKQEFAANFEKLVISYMKKIDYDLVTIGVAPNQNRMIPVPSWGHINMIHISERDNSAVLWQHDISQGMFRALSLIVLVTYNILKKLPTTMLIDDIGEGLDFDRSSKLIQLLMDLAETNDIQLIMSTNDRFVMNAVPLEYWQVIQRKGGECQVFNYKNAKQKFDEFEYTGLNNFDFLRTDFLNSNWEPV
ncbi:MAG: ATP-binding protein [Treponema sp.]|jgi:predicted ATPase|nr:ATP-binding protein [Treponema sp.]